MEMTIVVEVEVRNYKILIFIKAIVYRYLFTGRMTMQCKQQRCTRCTLSSVRMHLNLNQILEKQPENLSLCSSGSTASL